MNEQAARLRRAAEVIGRESREGWAITCESAAEEIDRLTEENKRLREAVKAAYALGRA